MKLSISTQPTPSIPEERRNRPRRANDRAEEDLHNTFSTSYCHACLEHSARAILLLAPNTHLIFTTARARELMLRRDAPFAFLPAFTLYQPHQASLFDAFVNGRKNTSTPLSLLVEGENGHNQTLISCFKLPIPTEAVIQTARYMITLFDSGQGPTQNWVIFVKQYHLTPAEERLCRTLAYGLTLKDYCERWHIAASTARSQLHTVFSKTSTHRQSDLLRLIFLFCCV